VFGPGGFPVDLQLHVSPRLLVLFLSAARAFTLFLLTRVQARYSPQIYIPPALFLFCTRRLPHSIVTGVTCFRFRYRTHPVVSKFYDTLVGPFCLSYDHSITLRLATAPRLYAPSFRREASFISTVKDPFSFRTFFVALTLVVTRSLTFSIASRCRLSGRKRFFLPVGTKASFSPISVAKNPLFRLLVQLLRPARALAR